MAKTQKRRKSKKGGKAQKVDTAPPSAEGGSNASGETARQPTPQRSPNKQEQDEKPPADFGGCISRLLTALSPKAAKEDRDMAPRIVSRAVGFVLSKHGVASTYNVLLFYDPTRLVRSDADKIYSAIKNFRQRKPILLLLYSSGGESGPAYLISKLCREHADGRFIVVVPRQAKSAATLICCGADEIHMGSLSELGPIDPQIGSLPALGLKDAAEHIAQLVQKYPQASDMFAKYLSSSLEPFNLGYCERVAESAKQYAERLLRAHQGSLPQQAEDIARMLVYDYKDHGFVIDKEEAKTVFGKNILKTDTKEYELGNNLYEALDVIQTICDFRGQDFFFIGSSDSLCSITKKRKK